MIDGLLQTEAYARVLYGERRPACTEEQVDRLVAARIARQVLVRATCDGKPHPSQAFQASAIRPRTAASRLPQRTERAREPLPLLRSHASGIERVRFPVSVVMPCTAEPSRCGTESQEGRR
ncbi:Scr1 family TA system antitoxin-like transcriptional regulator [Streptomyces poriferorum]|uniref:Scr1 family TA system antitoxin-like transcriptional regulator n=1 Tax=Streptomyces poriferorum TaxID=2798799 RepID=UPI003557D6B4